jgi:hypothetical protein
LQDPPKFTQIWIFCLKIYHLATLNIATPSEIFISIAGAVAATSEKKQSKV